MPFRTSPAESGPDDDHLAGSDRGDSAAVSLQQQVLQTLFETYPDATCALEFTTPFQLLVATVLSAQSTDKTVNRVTPALFARYPDPVALAAASQEQVEELIHPTGFFRNKATSLIGLANALVDDFDAQVPVALEDLVRLPGVGRKTAHVVRGHAFAKPAITTDTHVMRVSRRLGWTANTKPEKVEADLAGQFDPQVWTRLSDTLIFHGRARCHAKKPACGACPVAPSCPSFGAGPTEPEQAAKLVKDS